MSSRDGRKADRELLNAEGGGPLSALHYMGKNLAAWAKALPEWLQNGKEEDNESKYCSCGARPSI